MKTTDKYAEWVEAIDAMRERWESFTDEDLESLLAICSREHEHYKAVCIAYELKQRAVDHLLDPS